MAVAQTNDDLQDVSDHDLLIYAGMRDDEDLSGAALRESEDAFVELYQRHARNLYRILKRSVPGRIYASTDRHTLEELVDETFLHAIRASESFDPDKAKVETWLVTIAENLMTDHGRQAVRRLNGQEEICLDLSDAGEILSNRPFETESVDEAETDELEDEKLSLLRDAFEEVLTDRAFDLLTAYLSVQVDGEAQGQADAGAVQQLASRLETTPENLRVNKSRSIKKIRAFVKERMPDRVIDG